MHSAWPPATLHEHLLELIDIHIFHLAYMRITNWYRSICILAVVMWWSSPSELEQKRGVLYHSHILLLLPSWVIVALWPMIPVRSRSCSRRHPGTTGVRVCSPACTAVVPSGSRRRGCDRPVRHGWDVFRILRLAQLIRSSLLKHIQYGAAHGLCICS